MFKRLGLIAAMLVIVSAGARAHDFRTPEAPVEAYIKGVQTGSGDDILRAFSDMATIKYYDPEGNYRNYSPRGFADLVEDGDGFDAIVEITNMLRTGPVANATVEFTFGDEGEHGYVDYLNLLYVNGSWHITDKVSTYVKRR